MESIIAFVTSKLGAVGMFAAIPLLFLGIKKFLPKFLGKEVAAGLKKGFESIDKIEDPVERKLVEDIALAVVKWAEYKIPDAGQGKARYDLAAAKLCALLPFLKGREDAISGIIEAAVVAMDGELKKVEGKK